MYKHTNYVTPIMEAWCRTFHHEFGYYRFHKVDFVKFLFLSMKKPKKPLLPPKIIFTRQAEYFLLLPSLSSCWEEGSEKLTHCSRDGPSVAISPSYQWGIRPGGQILPDFQILCSHYYDFRLLPSLFTIPPLLVSDSVNSESVEERSSVTSLSPKNVLWGGRSMHSNN